jgi:co-chaperonin GroES (HSP10)
MKYRAFTRLIVQLIPEAQEEVSPGGIHLPESFHQPRNIAYGKVLDGFFAREGEVPTERIDGNGLSFIERGDTIAFSKAGAMNDGKGIFFLTADQVLAVVETE